MKTFALIALCAIALLAGCESVSDRVQDRFVGVAPHTRLFAADMKAVFAAAQQAVKNVGMQVGRKSLSDGRLEAYTAINSGSPVQDSRQTNLEVRLSPAETGETQVALVVSEHTEGKFLGGVSEQPLREHSLYEMYFTALQQVLLENGAIKSVGKP